MLKQSTADKSLYYLSRNKHKLSSSELRASLGKLISACPCPSLEEMLHSPQLLVSSKIQHCFEEDGEWGWYNGLVIGYNNGEHEVIYFGEETIYQFNFFKDFSSGNLKIDTLEKYFFECNHLA